MSDMVTPFTTPAWLLPILEEFEGKGFFEEEDLSARINRTLRENEAAPGPERAAALAESSAFAFRPLGLGEESRWGTHFAEQMVLGEHVDPDLARVDAATLAYWRNRMGEAKHPVLKARHADLLWDLSKPAGAARAPHDAAQVAARSYPLVPPLVTDEHNIFTAIARAARGLRVALSIRDQAAGGRGEGRPLRPRRQIRPRCVLDGLL
jgi:lysyl-tRNA synthetase class 1